MRWGILLALLAWSVSGCYGTKVLKQPVTVEETARDLEALRQQQVATETRLQELEKRASEQAELLRTLRAEGSARWGEFDQRLAAIDSKLRDALGQREGYARAPSIWGAAPPMKQPAASPETPPGDAGGGATGGGDSGAPPAGVPAGTAPGGGFGEPSANPMSEVEAKRVYDQAYKDLTRGNYSLAVLGFREFLRRAPASDLADNAQYWTGECYYAERDFHQAIQEFLQVPQNWPKGDKVPAALLKTGYAYLQIEDRPNARKYLNQVIDQYPDTEEATSAKNKLRSAM